MPCDLPVSLVEGGRAADPVEDVQLAEPPGGGDLGDDRHLEREASRPVQARGRWLAPRVAHALHVPERAVELGREARVLEDEVPPQADLIMCLWVLNHMPFDDCQAAIANLKASGNRWLLMTDRPKWHYEQPPEIRMEVTDELLLNPKTGDRIILVELNAPEVEDADYPGA
jgi:hypothetical protein